MHGESEPHRTFQADPFVRLLLEGPGAGKMSAGVILCQLLLDYALQYFDGRALTI